MLVSPIRSWIVRHAAHSLLGAPHLNLAIMAPKRQREAQAAQAAAKPAKSAKNAKGVSKEASGSDAAVDIEDFAAAEVQQARAPPAAATGSRQDA